MASNIKSKMISQLLYPFEVTTMILKPKYSGRTAQTI